MFKSMGVKKKTLKKDPELRAKMFQIMNNARGAPPPPTPPKPKRLGAVPAPSMQPRKKAPPPPKVQPRPVMMNSVHQGPVTVSVKGSG